MAHYMRARQAERDVGGEGKRREGCRNRGRNSKSVKEWEARNKDKDLRSVMVVKSRMDKHAILKRGKSLNGNVKWDKA